MVCKYKRHTARASWSESAAGCNEGSDLRRYLCDQLRHSLTFRIQLCASTLSKAQQQSHLADFAEHFLSHTSMAWRKVIWNLWHSSWQSAIICTTHSKMTEQEISGLLILYENIRTYPFAHQKQQALPEAKGKVKWIGYSVRSATPGSHVKAYQKKDNSILNALNVITVLSIM